MSVEQVQLSLARMTRVRVGGEPLIKIRDNGKFLVFDMPRHKVFIKSIGFQRFNASKGWKHLRDHLSNKEVKIKYSEEAGIKNVLNHLAERGLIEPRKLRDFMIIKDFDKMLESNDGNYTYTYMDISIKYDVSERTIQNIIYKHKRKYNKDYNIR